MRKIASVKALLIFFGASIWLASSTAAERGEAGLVWSQPRSFDPKFAAMRLHVKDNRLLTARGEAVWLRGVNIASLEWSNQGEHLDDALNHAVRDWKANIIRLPLAQDRWFGKAGNQPDAGAAYRAIVDQMVDASAALGAYIVLDLHWSDAGVWTSNGGRMSQYKMADRHSIPFWRDVATRYQNFPNVIFGLYNEPHNISWSVWRDGGSVAEKPPKEAKNQTPLTFQAAGLQQLYDSVRAAGAENVVTASGLDWGYDLRGVLQGFGIKGRNVMYETHPYPWKGEWDKNFGDVSKQFPVLMGEWGGEAKDLEYGKRLIAYAQQHHLHWTAWCFHPTAGPPLLKNWFEPSDFGRLVKDALAGSSATK